MYTYRLQVYAKAEGQYCFPNFVFTSDKSIKKHENKMSDFWNNNAVQKGHYIRTKERLLHSGATT